MGFSDPITAGDVLIREAIRSPNYNPGVSGWRIAKDGTAEFVGIVIQQGGLIQMSGATPTTPLITVIVTGDTTARWQVNANGDMNWSAGSGAVDTNLYRSAADNLRTDDLMSSTRITHAHPAFSANVQADSNDRWIVTADGSMTWGPGNVGGDTTLARSAVGTLRTAGTLEVGTDLKTGPANVSIGRGTWNFTVQAGNIAGVTGAETTIIDSGPITWKAGRAYSIEVQIYALTSVGGDQAQVRLRRATLGGTNWADWFAAVQMPVGGGSNNVPFYAQKVMARTAGTDLTGVNVLVTGNRFSGTGTLQFNQNTGVGQTYVLVRDIGAASDYPNAMAIT